jgi:DNA polymerase-3 subunit beta
MSTATMTTTAHVAAKEFREAAKFAAGVVPNRTPFDVIYNVRLTLGAEGRVSGTDAEVSATATFGGVDCGGEIDVLVPARTLVSVLSDSDETARCDFDGSKLTIRIGQGKYDLKTSDPALFPAVGYVPDEPPLLSMSAEDFASAMAKSVMAVGEDDRYAIAGVCFDPENGGSLAATDKRRLSVLPLHAGCEGSGEYLIPRKAAAALSRVEGGTVDLWASPASVAVRCGTRTLVTRLLDGRFPRYRSIIPQRPPHEVEIVAGPVRDGLRRAMGFVNPEDEWKVRLSLANGELSISASGEASGDCEVRVPVAFNCECEWDVNGRFLTDFLSRLDGSESALLAFTDGDSALKFTVGDWVYLVMPRIKDGQ